MIARLKTMGANMSIKLHYRHNHLDRFPNNLGDFSEEHGERFHQDMKLIEDRYQGRWNRYMMAEYCWTIQSDSPACKHKRKSYKKYRFAKD